MANSVDPDEAAHYEPPHLYQYCLQIQQFSVLMFSAKSTGVSMVYGLSISEQLFNTLIKVISGTPCKNAPFRIQQQKLR